MESESMEFLTRPHCTVQLCVCIRCTKVARNTEWEFSIATNAEIQFLIDH